MKNIKYTLILSLLMIAGLSSCDFGDTNVPPDQPADVSLSALLPNAETTMAFNVGGEFVRFGGLLTQHFAGTNAQQIDNARYLIREADVDGMWQNMYENAMNPLNIIIKKATEQNAPHYRGMAKVLMAVALGTLTDAFGDIPYSEALKADQGITQPKYDGQQALYGAIHTLLNEAVTDLGAASSPGGSPKGDDVIFKGDRSLWIKAAKSLHARYYLQTAKVNANAYTEALTALNAGGVITSNAEDFVMNFGTAPNEPNPQYQFQQDRNGNIDIKSGVYFLDLMLNLSDPRIPSLVKFNGSYFLSSDSYYTSINSPVVFIDYAELKFIEAEALLMSGAPIINVEAALAAGITASITKITGSNNASYVSTNSALIGLANNSARLEKIIEQKYIAMYSHGIVPWSDYRRTGFPTLTPAANGSNAFNSNGQIPRRFPYPQTERLNNLANIPTTTPNLQARFWWDL